MTQTLFPRAGGVLPASLAGREMPALIHGFDWASTAVGPISAWPEALRSTVRMMLSSAVPMVMLMGEKGVLVYNDGYAIFAGNRHPGVLGKEVALAWPEIADFNEALLKRVLSGESISLPDQKLTLNRTGVFEDAWMDLDYSPVLDDDGTPIAELVIVSETTMRYLAERALARSEERLQISLAGSGIVGIWDWDIPNDIVQSDRRFAEMYGVDPERAEAGAPLSAFVAGVHADDRAHLEESIAAALQQGSAFKAEYRLRSPSGDIRWVLATGTIFRGEDGKPTRLAGVVVDITERREQEVALTESEAKFRAIADSMPQMVWSTQPNGFHDYYNARWYEFTGVPPGSTDGAGWNDMFHPEDQERAWEAWRHSLETGEPYQIEYRLKHHSGQYRWTLGRALPVRDTAGRIVRWMGTCTDIHETKLAAEEREIVAQELSHRIKNIFSVLNGLIALSSRTQPEIRPLAEELRVRIAALGTAHDFVRPHSRASRPETVDTTVQGLLSTLLKPYDDGQGRIAVSGDDPVIDDRSATPIALLFHELATNSAKYGALAAPEGRLTVGFAIDEDDFRIDWKESGLNGVSAPQREGFGSRLVTLSVEGQLSGKVSRAWEADGLRMSVTIPRRSLRRDG